jgi:hypothetical protein
MRLIRIGLVALASALALALSAPAWTQPSAALEEAPLDLDSTEKKLGGALQAP